MSEEKLIPAKTLDAAVIAWFKRRSVTDTWINANRARRSLLWVAVEQGVQAALEAAGVLELASAREAIGAALFRHGYDTGWTTQEVIECIDAMAARIAELEAALALAIPRMEHLQSLLSCGELVQFCNEFDEQEGKDVAKEIERLKRVMQNAPTGAGGRE